MSHLCTSYYNTTIYNMDLFQSEMLYNIQPTFNPFVSIRMLHTNVNFCITL